MGIPQPQKKVGGSIAVGLLCGKGGPHVREVPAWEGAVEDSSSWDDRPCFFCMERQKICCMPLEATATRATMMPTALPSMSVSFTVLRRQPRRHQVGQAASLRQTQCVTLSRMCFFHIPLLHFRVQKKKRNSLASFSFNLHCCVRW